MAHDHTSRHDMRLVIVLGLSVVIPQELSLQFKNRSKSQEMKALGVFGKAISRIEVSDLHTNT